MELENKEFQIALVIMLKDLEEIINIEISEASTKYCF